MSGDEKRRKKETRLEEQRVSTGLECGIGQLNVMAFPINSRVLESGKGDIRNARISD